MKITYEVNPILEKIFVNNIWDSLEYHYQIIFTELTLQDRILLGFQTIDSDGIELTGDNLTNFIIFDSKHLPPLGNEEEIKILIKERIERRIQEIKNKLNVISDGTISLI